MSDVWITIAVLSVGTIALKATGPVVLGGREPGERTFAVISLFAPALLAALVVYETLGTGEQTGMEIDARLVGLATAFRRLALGVDGSGSASAASLRVATAIREHPAYVSGTTRDECALLRAVPGAIGKAGAESCYAVALPDGRAFALKTDDGAPRVRPVLMAAALRRSGVDREAGVDTEAVRRTGTALLLGGGLPVGEIRAVF